MEEVEQQQVAWVSGAVVVVLTVVVIFGGRSVARRWMVRQLGPKP